LNAATVSGDAPGTCGRPQRFQASTSRAMSSVRQKR